MNNYTITTPDEFFINFEHVTKESVSEILAGNNINQLPEGYPLINLTRAKAYLLPDGKVLEINLEVG